MVRRGFDTDEVRSYLQSVARNLETLEAREEELRAALTEAEERAAHPVVDEATLTTSLGQHSAQILRHAHEEAARIVVQAQEGAATLLRETQTQVNELQESTEASTAERVVEVELLVANAEQDVVIDEKSISKAHASFKLAPGTFEITDLQSRNGVKVNGVKVVKGQSAPVKSFDVIHLGDVTLLFLSHEDLFDQLPALVG